MSRIVNVCPRCANTHNCPIDCAGFKNPSDCICMGPHCTNPTCKSRMVSKGDVTELDRKFPVPTDAYPMRTREYLLIKLIEECTEVAQRATKALTFGIHEVQKGQDLNNAQRLSQEFTDLIAVSEMLNRCLPGGDCLSVHNETAKEEKKAKIQKYAGYSKRLGVL